MSTPGKAWMLECCLLQPLVGTTTWVLNPRGVCAIPILLACCVASQRRDASTQSDAQESSCFASADLTLSARRHWTGRYSRCYMWLRPKSNGQKTLAKKFR
ncbi:hypothetical protein HDK77DRAFT_160792 [Phyllosticta capitalensis]